MIKIPVTIVRIYTLEGSKVLKTILEYLHNDAKVRGVSVFRAIDGFGDSGTHSASIINLSIALPLVIEFFDHPDKIDDVLEYINPMLKTEHILFFSGLVNG